MARRSREDLPEDELIGELIRDKLVYYPTVTREPFRNRGRITDLITSGKLFEDLGLAPLDQAPIASCSAARPRCWRT